jgi:hypothetical protein
VKVAAYQAPLLRSGSLEAVDLIRTRVEWCESHGVVILCCPEAIDYAADPREFAIDARGDQLARALAPLASDTVTTIVGFTEVTGTGRLYNSAAVFVADLHAVYPRRSRKDLNSELAVLHFP